MTGVRSVYELAEEWIEWDECATTRNEISRLKASNNVHELERRLRSRVSFGTAGLRGTVEAGYVGLNGLTVIQASQGIARYLLHKDPQIAKRGVLIGHDHRCYNSISSSYLASLAAGVFHAFNFKVYFYNQFVHTPLVPFGVAYLGTACGIMITASHNPATDNGLKLYWSNGCQIIPPIDSDICNEIEKNLKPIIWNESPEVYPDPFQTISEAYFNSLLQECPSLQSNSIFSKIVYTPMHGVGLPFFRKAMQNLGSGRAIHVVPEQAAPDPAFPTVKFPNPEEKGTLDLAMAYAEKVGAPLVFATDPDADRFAMAEQGAEGWHIFTGNEIGILLAVYALRRYKKSHTDLSKLYMLTSYVSTQMLRQISAMEGFKYEETLTGFKWLGNRALCLREEGYDVEFAFEEAIGFMFGQLYDKDGIGAAVFCTSLADELYSQGSTFLEELQQLNERYGFYKNLNFYYMSPTTSVTNGVFASIRQTIEPQKCPCVWQGQTIDLFQDMTADYLTNVEQDSKLIATSGQMVAFHFPEGRAIIRSSGTEPKIKVYIEAKAASIWEATMQASRIAKFLSIQFFSPQSLRCSIDS